MQIKIIDSKSKKDITIKNEPFELYGKVIPTYLNEKWDYDIQLFPKEKIMEMCFPDEDYDFDEMSKNSVFIGAYENGECVGLAIVQDNWSKHMYLYDLKVKKEYRHSGVGKALLEKAKEVALKKGYKGIYTIGQDNNVTACKFYLKMGFVIGGFDNHVYGGTSQEGKADIIFYLELLRTEVK